MLESPLIKAGRLDVPRLLPEDKPVHFALIDCHRDLDSATEVLRVFRTLWFGHDPPDREKARIAAGDLELAATRLRGAARELLRATDPAPR